MRYRVLLWVSLALSHCSKSPTGGTAASTSARAEPAPLAPAASAAAAASTALTAASAEAAPSGSAASRTLATVSSAALKQMSRDGARKGTIINAFASWCGPCKRELPMLQALADNLGRQGIGVIVVSVDEPEDNQKASAFLASLEVKLPSYIAQRPLGPFKEGLYPRWPGMLPATFLLDEKGSVRYFWGGPVQDDEILTIVEGFLAGKPIDGESDFTLAPGIVEH